MGLPIQLRTPENISKILNRYGKVLSVDEDVWKFTDLSSCKGRILTESRTRINDEIVIEFGQGKFMKIEIIELEVNLAPFEAGEIWGENNNDINDENDSSDDDDDNDNNNDAYDSGSDMEGMSDTWNNNAKDEQEEGEIHDDEQMNVKEQSCGSPTDNNEVLEVVESVANADDAGLENMLEDDIVAESQFNPPADKRGDTNDVLIDDQGPVNKDATANLKATARLNYFPNTDPGILNFGPFPSWTQTDPRVLPNLPESPKNFESTSPFEVDRSNDKRRKFSKFTCTKSCPPITDNERNSFSIDLNRDVPNRQTEACDNISNDESHASQELRKTVEVGLDLGFEIGADNQILQEVLVGAGVNIVA
ncbi:hypothetical protein L1887_22251 [Cichorium endivia]|nr:hypothetical protein L1887_22251 [Cichorium endivia]